MKDPAKELVKALYTALDNASITWNSTAVPTYSVVPDSAEYPYIYISSTATGDLGCKTSYVTNTQSDIDVVTGAKKRGSRTAADGIMDKVTVALADDATLSMTNFTNCLMRIENIEYHEEMSDTDRLIVKRLTITNVLEES